MRRINLIALAVVAICLLAAPLACGQGGNPPASTKESGATSGKGMTAVEQTDMLLFVCLRAFSRSLRLKNLQLDVLSWMRTRA
jgi:hypothetical protein